MNLSRHRLLLAATAEQGVNAAFRYRLCILFMFKKFMNNAGWMVQNYTKL